MYVLTIDTGNEGVVPFVYGYGDTRYPKEEVYGIEGSALTEKHKTQHKISINQMRDSNYSSI